MNFTMSISPEDCTGCGVCAKSCPHGALEMANVDKAIKKGYIENWEYSMSLPFMRNPMDKFTVKGS